MAQQQPLEISNLFDISERYDGFLFDAYGVLLNASGAIPAALDCWHELRRRGKSCWILTNGSARTLPEAVAAYRAFGLDVQLHEVISSGSLLARYYQEQGLKGCKTAVLGTDSTRQLVREAGGEAVDLLSEQGDFAVLVLGNQTEYPLLASLDEALSQVCQRVERGLPCHLILTNPDLIYPKATGRFGFTAGALALMLQAGLNLRLGSEAPQFVGLGKPFAPIFAEAERRAGHRRLLMIGDQLETDVLGASQYGIDSVLVGTGLTRITEISKLQPMPTYILRRWEAAGC